MPFMWLRKPGTLASFFLLVLLSNSLPATNSKSKPCSECQKTSDSCQCQPDHREGTTGNAEGKATIEVVPDVPETSSADEVSPSHRPSDHCQSCKHPHSNCECVREKPKAYVLPILRDAPDHQPSTSHDREPPPAAKRHAADMRARLPFGENMLIVPLRQELSFQLPDPVHHSIPSGQGEAPRLEPADSCPTASEAITVGTVNNVPVQYFQIVHADTVSGHESSDEEETVDHLSSLLAGPDVQAILVVTEEMAILNQFTHMLQEFIHSSDSTDFDAITQEAISIFHEFNPDNVTIQGANPNPPAADVYLLFVNDDSLIRLVLIFRNPHDHRLLYIFINSLAVIQVHISEPEGLSLLVDTLKEQQSDEQARTESGCFPSIYIISMNLNSTVEGLDELWSIAEDKLEKAIEEGGLVLEQLEKSRIPPPAAGKRNRGACVIHTTEKGFDLDMRRRLLSLPQPQDAIPLPFVVETALLKSVALQIRDELVGASPTVSIFGAASYQLLQTPSQEGFTEEASEDSQYVIAIISASTEDDPLIIFVSQFGGASTLSLHTFQDVLTNFRGQTTNQRLIYTMAVEFWKQLGSILKDLKDKTGLKVFKRSQE